VRDDLEFDQGQNLKCAALARKSLQHWSGAVIVGYPFRVAADVMQLTTPPFPVPDAVNRSLALGRHHLLATQEARDEIACSTAIIFRTAAPWRHAGQVITTSII